MCGARKALDASSVETNTLLQHSLASLSDMPYHDCAPISIALMFESGCSSTARRAVGARSAFAVHFAANMQSFDFQFVWKINRNYNLFVSIDSQLISIPSHAREVFVFLIVVNFANSHASKQVITLSNVELSECPLRLLLHFKTLAAISNPPRKKNISFLRIIIKIELNAFR